MPEGQSQSRVYVQQHSFIYWFGWNWIIFYGKNIFWFSRWYHLAALSELCDLCVFLMQRLLVAERNCELWLQFYWPQESVNRHAKKTEQSLQDKLKLVWWKEIDNVITVTAVTVTVCFESHAEVPLTDVQGAKLARKPSWYRLPCGQTDLR